MLLLFNNFRDPLYQFAEERDNQYDIKHLDGYLTLLEKSRIIGSRC